jgi:DUF4097 and DUF4098 domain-containing protein YvlB
MSAVSRLRRHFTGLLLLAASSFAALGYESNLDKTFQVSPGGLLVLEADQGSCVLNPVEGDQVQVRVFRQVKGGSQAQADALFAGHEVTFQQEGRTVSVRARSRKQGSFSWRANQPYLEVRYEISLPRKFEVDLKTSGGDLRMGDLEGNVKARTSSGAIALKHITGAVAAENSGGDILVEEAGGDLTAHTSSGAIRVQKVGGKAKLSNSGGDILVGEADSSVVAKTSSGAIRLKTIKGEVEASDSGGDIGIEEAGGEVTVSTSSGSLRIGRAKGQTVTAKNSGGDIVVGEVEGKLRASTSSGAIRIRVARGAVVASNSGGEIAIEQAGDTVKAETSSGAIRIQAAKGSVEAGNSGGNISIGEAGAQVLARTSSGFIHIKAVTGPVEARNSGGDIAIGEARGPVQASTSSGTLSVGLAGQPSQDCRLEVSGGGIKLSVPKSLAINLDARSSGGEVLSELPITRTDPAQRGSAVLQGKLNGGGPTLYLRSSSGNIQLKASRALPAAMEAEEPVK